jgi:(p)ppGpp synthase/HD superfamily hydrolase
VSTNADHTATVVVTLQVASVAQLAKVLTRLEGLKDVYTVQRDFG